MSRPRRNGNGKSYAIYVSNGILEPKHRERMGMAIWTFLYFIDKTTEDRPHKKNAGEYEGWVYGGMPLTLARIAEETGSSERTISRHISQLAVEEYIVVTLAPRGLIIRVQKSLKFENQRKKTQPVPSGLAKNTGRSGDPTHAKCGVPPGRNGVPPGESGEPNKILQLTPAVDIALGGDTTALASAVSPSPSNSNSESQSQPQEKSNPVLTGKTQSPRPYTDSILRSGLGGAGLCEMPKPKRRYIPKTEAQIQDDLRKVREMFPEEFARAGKVAGV